MSILIVYHGSTDIVEHPDVLHSFRALDFGKGFYVTTVLDQAKRWAKRRAILYGAERAVINRYQMRQDMRSLKVKTFAEDYYTERNRPASEL